MVWHDDVNWNKQLEGTTVEKRDQAEKVGRKLQAQTKKETQSRNRQRQATCVEKAQAVLQEQSKSSAWQRITNRHIKWLEMQKTFGSYQHMLQQLNNQFHYSMLIKEAEEAERVIADL